MYSLSEILPPGYDSQLVRRNSRRFPPHRAGAARSEDEEATGPVTPDLPLFPFVPPGTHDQPIVCLRCHARTIGKGEGHVLAIRW
jgi:hypothetical protein